MHDFPLYCSREGPVSDEKPDSRRRVDEQGSRRARVDDNACPRARGVAATFARFWQNERADAETGDRQLASFLGRYCSHAALSGLR